MKKYEIDYGGGFATLYTPSVDWENRFLALAGVCFGIRKSIMKVDLLCESVVEPGDDYSKRKQEDEYERLEFCGDAYIWREDGARKMVSPTEFADEEWDTSFCQECREAI